MIFCVSTLKFELVGGVCFLENLQQLLENHKLPNHFPLLVLVQSLCSVKGFSRRAVSCWSASCVSPSRSGKSLKPVIIYCVDNILLCQAVQRVSWLNRNRVILPLFYEIECLYLAYRIFFDHTNFFLNHVKGSYIANQTKFSGKNPKIQTSPNRLTDFFPTIFTSF